MEKHKSLHSNIMYIITKTEKIDAKIVEKLAKFMPKERLTKYYKITDENKKVNYVLAYLILWFSLKKNNILATPPSFQYEKNFKPKVVCKYEVFFNISHTKSAVICAISSNPIGVDIEKSRNVSIKLAKKICTKKEYFMFSNAKNKKRMFFFIWTRKESFCKKNNTSIFNNFNKINSFSLKNTLTFYFENFTISSCSKNSRLIFKNTSLKEICKTLSLNFI